MGFILFKFAQLRVDLPIRPKHLTLITYQYS